MPSVTQSPVSIRDGSAKNPAFASALRSRSRPSVGHGVTAAAVLRARLLGLLVDRVAPVLGDPVELPGLRDEELQQDVVRQARAERSPRAAPANGFGARGLVIAAATGEHEHEESERDEATGQSVQSFSPVIFSSASRNEA